MLSLEEFQELYCNEIAGEAVVSECGDWSEPLFNAYDANQSGYLDSVEFASLYDTFCPCNKDIDELFQEYDVNQDGLLDLDEYSLLLCSEL